MLHRIDKELDLKILYLFKIDVKAASVKSEISPITRISTEMEIAITGRFINIFPFILMGH